MEKPAQIHGIYNRAVLTTKVLLNISEIGSNIKQILEQHISHRVKNKCQAEGYIRYNTIEILEYSQGLVKGIHQEFQVVYECLVCHPTEGMVIDNVECKNISLAGIRAFYHEQTSDTKPLEIFLAKDFHYNNSKYDKIKEGDTFSVRVIGIRFELNDSHITVMASLHNPQANQT